ncbi:MAG: hypothetical protein ACYC6Y_15210 [Thermoguttaceae bacterium]
MKRWIEPSGRVTKTGGAAGHGLAEAIGHLFEMGDLNTGIEQGERPAGAEIIAAQAHAGRTVAADQRDGETAQVDAEIIEGELETAGPRIVADLDEPFINRPVMACYVDDRRQD